MNWRETLLKSENIKWKHHLKTTKDDRLDFDLHLPLTELFEMQAKTSYTAGVLAMLQFHVSFQTDNKSISTEDLIGFFESCGLSELANRLKADADLSSNEGDMKR